MINTKDFLFIMLFLNIYFSSRRMRGHGTCIRFFKIKNGFDIVYSEDKPHAISIFYYIKAVSNNIRL